MIVNTAQPELKKALSLVLPAVAPRSTLPILANIRIEADDDGLTLQATNLEVGVTHVVKCFVQADGATTLPAKLFADLIGSLPSADVSLTLNENTQAVTVACGRSRATVKGVSADDFPNLPPLGKPLTTYISADALRADLQQILCAAATDDGRPVLQGVLWRFSGEQAAFAATDGFRLAVRSYRHEPTAAESLLIPARSLATLCKMLAGSEEPVHVWSNGAQVSFIHGATTLTTRIIEGGYPDFERIIPARHDTRVIVATAALASAVRRASLFAANSGNVLKLSVGSDTLSISAASSEQGDGLEQVDASVSGDAVAIAVNAAYFAEAVGCITAAETALELQTPEKPLVIKAVGDDGYLHLVMPMSVR